MIPRSGAYGLLKMVVLGRSMVTRLCFSGRTDGKTFSLSLWTLVNALYLENSEYQVSRLKKHSLPERPELSDTRPLWGRFWRELLDVNWPRFRFFFRYRDAP